MSLITTIIGKYKIKNRHLHAVIPPLDGQTCLRAAENRDFFLTSEAWNLPTSGCKSMVEGPTIMLGVFITLLYIHTMPNIYYCSTCMLLYPHLMATLVWELAENRDIFLIWGDETRQHGAVKVWWRALQSCWECSSLCYTSIQCQTSTIVAPACCYIPTWWPNLFESWQKIEIFSWSEAWNPPTWGCKSMVEGLTIMLVVLLTFLYI